MAGLLLILSCAFLLPTDLNRPEPSQTAQPEIAPEPPDPIKPRIGNVAKLCSWSPDNGLGDGGWLQERPAPPPPSRPPVVLAGAGRVPPAQYECVAGRQTEDAISPTCVPFFIGSNGGATAQGVTASEVRVVIYYDAIGTVGTSQGTSTPPVDTIIDVDAPPRAREHPAITANRSWQSYFYRRYAAYHRKVHLFVQFGSADGSTAQTPGQQAADAAKAYVSVRPFAIVNYSGHGMAGYYTEYMAQHGVLVFGAPPGHNNQFYSHFPGLQWGYNPTLEYSAQQYADAACSILKDRPADGMGGGTTGPAQNGQPRKYGLLYTTDPDWQGVTAQALLAERLISRECGITAVVRQHYDHNGNSVDNDPSRQSYGENIALQFQRAGVTTVLWPAGHETKVSAAMGRNSYFPEIIAGDDDLQASIVTGRFQDQRSWGQAWVVTSQTYEPPPAERVCTQAYRSVDGATPAQDVNAFACPEYRDLRQLHTAIQAAGPKLTAQTINQGMHAIPRIETTNAQLPTCYYLANDYTCVKDSAIMRWDPTALAPTQAQPGCWRMVGNGKRFLPGRFPQESNLAELAHPGDVCNNYVAPGHLQL